LKWITPFLLPVKVLVQVDLLQQKLHFELELENLARIFLCDVLLLIWINGDVEELIARIRLQIGHQF